MDDKEPSVKSEMTRFEKYCERIGINSNLVMLKVTLFIAYGAAAALLPFMTIHMQSIGLTVEEIAVIYLALPLTTFLSPPLTGLMVDKFGHYKVVLIVALLLNAVFHQALMLIPQMEIPGETPEAYVLRHPETGKVEVWWSPCPSRECPEDEEYNLVLENCYDHCQLFNQSKGPIPLLKGIHESIAVRPPSFLDPVPCQGVPAQGLNPTFGILPEDLHFHVDKKKNSTTTNKPKKGSSKTGDDRSRQNVTSPQSGREANLSTEEPERAAFFLLDMHPDLMEAQEHFGIELEPEENETVTDFRQHFSEELLTRHGVNYNDLEEADLRCGGLVLATNLTYDTLKELASDCMLQKCGFREGGPEVCPPNYKESDDKVFWIYFLLRFLGTTMSAATVTVLDPLALTMVQKYGGEFGKERLFSTLGMAVFSPLSGYLIDYRSRKLGYTDYSAAFYTYTTLSCLTCLCVLMMPVGAKLPADHLMKDMMKLFKLPHVIVFILFIFALGNCWGFIESYLFLYLKELGAPNYLLGVTVTVGTLSSIPFLYGAEGITKKFGHVNLIIVAFFSHAMRLVGYSYIDDAWWCFPFEAMEATSIHLMWVAATTYCSVIAPTSLLATLIGILGMSHFSLGRGSGSFFGGLLISAFGIRQSFRVMGLMAVKCGILYSILHFFWLHKFTAKKKKQEKANDAAEAEKLNQTDQEEPLEENIERLSLMIRFNHRGSLTSLSADHLKGGSRRNSSSSELTRGPMKPGFDLSGLKQAPSPGAIRVQPLVKVNKVSENSTTPQQVRKPLPAVPPVSAKGNSCQPFNPNEEFRTRSDSILEEDESQMEDGAANKNTVKTEEQVK